jgi:hypothetical protein
MSIGAYIADAIQNIVGEFGSRPVDEAYGNVWALYSPTYSPLFTERRGAEIVGGSAPASGGQIHPVIMRLDASRVVRATNETRGASVSVYVCITY